MTEQTEKNLITLLHQHDLHWAAIAEKLGGICLGGVDGDVNDPYGNAGVIIAHIDKLMEKCREN